MQKQFTKDKTYTGIKTTHHHFYVFLYVSMTYEQEFTVKESALYKSGSRTFFGLF